MPHPNSLPPALATSILTRVLPAFSRDAILGDMQETFAQLEMECGVAAARRWYWRETLAALPGFTLHSLQANQIRRQTVAGNTVNDSWFGRQNSGLIAGIGFLLLLPALLAVGFAKLFLLFGKSFMASMNSIPGVAQFVAWMESGIIEIGDTRFPIGIIMMGGLFIALVVNVLAVVQFKFESEKEGYHLNFLVKRKLWNLVILVMIVLVGFGMDWLIN